MVVQPRARIIPRLGPTVAAEPTRVAPSPDTFAEFGGLGPRKRVRAVTQARPQSLAGRYRDSAQLRANRFRQPIRLGARWKCTKDLPIAIEQQCISAAIHRVIR